MRLNTFGRAHVARVGGEEVALQPLPIAVLTYLAVGGPRDRDHLAGLFWHNSKNGLNSLSTTLNRIRAEVPGAVWVRGNTLVGTDLASDASELRDALERSDFAAMTQLYTAPFLQGLKLRRQSVEFEEWVLEERATLAGMVELALLQRGRNLQDAGNHRDAALAAEEAWEIAIRDGFPSPDYFEAYHRILASVGSPTANAVRSLAEEFGIALPAVQPVALDSSASPTTPNPPVAPVSPGDQPIVGGATPLYGFQKELEAIESSVSSESLTTIIGLGGSGKTRLAAEFFNRPQTERDFRQSHWVNLRDVTNAELVDAAIATALGQRFNDVASLAGQLPDDEPILVVLDNFEHVLPAAGIVEELARSNDALRILVTSRVPLGVSAESLVRLTGLETSTDELDSPAEQVFVSAARRAGADSAHLNESSRAVIRDICRRVGGTPLALELAGGWMQILSPTKILEALTVDDELLGSPLVGDLRPMNVVLDQSWATLTESEQRTLMMLAAFPGGCLTDEALKMPELRIRSIARLVQHSLARLQVEGRLTLHPLIAGYALSELEQRPELHRQFRQVLSRWCQTFAAVHPTSVDTTHARRLGPEVANFAAAWLWDAQHGLWGLHHATVEPLRQFFTESGRISEGRALFSTVADALRADPNHPPDLLAEVLEALGWFEVVSGEIDQARMRLDDALALSPDDRPHLRSQIFRTVGALHLGTGAVDEAIASFNAGLTLIADDPGPLTATLQHDLAQAHHYRGARDQARSAARLALEAGRSSNNWLAMARSYLLLADIEVETDPQRAIVLLNEGWAIAKDASLDHLAIYFPTILASAHLSLGEAELAESYFSDGLHAANEIGQLSTVCGNYVGRAEARLMLDNTSDAVDDLRTGIRLALKTGSGRYLMWAAVVSCRAAAPSASNERTMTLLSLALGHPAADQDARNKAMQTWQELFDNAPRPISESASDDRAAGLDEVAERALELLQTH